MNHTKTEVSAWPFETRGGRRYRLFTAVPAKPPPEGEPDRGKRRREAGPYGEKPPRRGRTGKGLVNPAEKAYNGQAARPQKNGAFRTKPEGR